MTAAEAAAALADAWRAVRSGPASEATITRAREAYAHADRAEQRAAHAAYKRHGVTLGDPPPAIARRFALGVGESDTPDIVDGWDDGTRWNGWGCPLVDLATAQRFVAALTTWDLDTTYRWGAGTCPDRPTLIECQDGDESAVEPLLVKVETPDGGTADRWLYPFSLGFTWDVLDPDDAIDAAADDPDFLLSVAMDDDEPATMTFAAFMAANIEIPTLGEIAALAPGQTIAIGGGAAPAVTITRVAP